MRSEDIPIFLGMLECLVVSFGGVEWEVEVVGMGVAHAVEGVGINQGNERAGAGIRVGCGARRWFRLLLALKRTLAGRGRRRFCPSASRSQ